MSETLDARIAAAGKEQLAALLTALAANDRTVAAILDRELPPLSLSAPASSFRVDLKQVARRVTDAVREAYRGRYPSPTMVSREMAAALAPADAALAAGDAMTALQVHDTAWTALAAGGGGLWQDECELSDELDELGEKLAVTLLAARLEETGAEAWVEKINDWQYELSGDALEESLALAREAAAEGWLTPEIQAALAGELSRNALKPSSPVRQWGGAGRLNALRLSCLEQRGDWDAFLHLAQAAGLIQEEVRVLLRLGRNPEAIRVVEDLSLDLAEALAVARLLAGAGQRDAALNLAARVLAAAPAVPERGALAKWARDAAVCEGLPERALECGRDVLRSQPSLDDYVELQRLAGSGWAEIRDAVLEDVCRSHFWLRPRVEILLHEGEVERAISILGSHPGHELAALVAEAAMESHPEWVFTASVNEFNRIADPGKSQYYGAAAAWMARAKSALQNAGRGAEWPAFLGDVLARHGRKHSLKPLLLKLR